MFQFYSDDTVLYPLTLFLLGFHLELFFDCIPAFAICCLHGLGMVAVHPFMWTSFLILDIALWLFKKAKLKIQNLQSTQRIRSLYVRESLLND